jgi:hypothetical protein
METKHTPTPWKVNDCRDSGWMDNAIYIAKDSGENLARVYKDYGNVEANAAFIVRAVNAHDELVAKLSAVQSILNSLTIGTQTTAFGRDRSNALRDEANRIINSALAKARGEA